MLTISILTNGWSKISRWGSPWGDPRGILSKPFVLSQVHRVQPELVAEVTYLTWTADGLLRQVVYEGLREDKSPRDVRRPVRLSRAPSERCCDIGLAEIVALEQ